VIHSGKRKDFKRQAINIDSMLKQEIFCAALQSEDKIYVSKKL
jgi:hypothetical protein